MKSSSALCLISLKRWPMLERSARRALHWIFTCSPLGTFDFSLHLSIKSK